MTCENRGICPCDRVPLIYGLRPEHVSGLLGTELHAARLGQIEAEQRLRALIDCAPEAILMLDVETGRFIDSNPAERLFGLPRDRLHEVGHSP